MNSPAIPMDVGDINVHLLSAKKKVRSVSSPALRDLDQMSLCNFPMSADISITEELGVFEKQGSSGRKRSREDFDTQSVDITFREPTKKKVRRPLSSKVSLSNIFKDSPFRNAKRSIKRSLSFKDHQGPPPPSPASKYRLPATPKQNGTLHRRRLPNKAHLPSNWVDVVDTSVQLKYSKSEIKRQEAIYSIYRTESELVEDLRMVVNIFFHPMLRLGLVSEEGHCKIFGNIQTILSLHEDLLSKLEELRSCGEVVENIGSVMLEWSRTLEPYAQYCANLLVAKPTLEAKKLEPPVEDFLQRCLDSEFSRKIDLWTFIDSPRSRIMKYPILLKEVKSKTPIDHKDQILLDESISSFDKVIKSVDRMTGIARCLDVVSRLEYLHEEQKCPELDDVKFIQCSGILRNRSSSKLQAFLFDKVFVLTRPSSRHGTLNYQVYRQPIPVEYLVVEDLTDGDARTNGSFRGTLKSSTSNIEKGKYFFKLSCSRAEISRHSHTLQANSDFDKKAWLDAFKAVKAAATESNAESKKAVVATTTMTTAPTEQTLLPSSSVTKCTSSSSVTTV